MDETFVRVGGIEPPSSAWKADILPLNYTRNAKNYSIFFVQENPPGRWVFFE